jgi:hypothetical protein
MSEFRVTFGQKYRREGHPAMREVHPDGWVAVFASDYDEARRIVVERFGTAWSGLYEPKPDDLDYYPRGELARIGAQP